MAISLLLRPVVSIISCSKARREASGCVPSSAVAASRKERQLEGIAKAKAEGVYKGRKPSIDVEAVRRLRDEEKLGPTEIAARLKIGRASVYRVLGERV